MVFFLAEGKRAVKMLPLLPTCLSDRLTKYMCKGNYRQRDQGFPTARVITSSKKPNITIEDGYSDRVEKIAFWTF